MEPETRERIDKLGIVASLVLMAIAVAGEALGWWNDLGIVLAVASLLIGAPSVLDLNGRRLVRSFGPLVGRQGTILHNQGKMLDNQDAMLHNQGKMLHSHARMLDNQGKMLDNQGRMLHNQGAMLDVLRDIHTVLDERLPPTS